MAFLPQAIILIGFVFLTLRPLACSARFVVSSRKAGSLVSGLSLLAFDLAGNTLTFDLSFDLAIDSLVLHDLT